MTNASYATNQLIGAKLLATSQTALFSSGTLCTGNNASEWVYVKCVAGATLGYTCQIDVTTFLATMITTANSVRGSMIGVPQVAFDANDYGWMQINGFVAAIQVAGSTSVNVRLNTTTTAGQLGTDATAGSKNIDVMTLTTVNGGSAATQPGNLMSPVVGTTN